MKRELDEETRQKLLGLLPFSDDARDQFTPEVLEELPDDVRPVFLLRTYSADERRKVRAILKKARDRPNDADVERQMVDFARLAVVGWEKLTDVGTCEDVEFLSEADGGANRRSFESLGARVQAQLLHRAARISGLLEVEKVSLE